MKKSLIAAAAAATFITGCSEPQTTKTEQADVFEYHGSFCELSMLKCDLSQQMSSKMSNSFNTLVPIAINGDDNIISHPADACVSQLGPIKEGRLFQAKGHYFDACELLGGDKALAEEFIDGEFATLYLSPPISR